MFRFPDSLDCSFERLISKATAPRFLKPLIFVLHDPLHSGSRMRDKVNGRKSLQKVLLQACQESDGGQHFWPRHDYLQS